MRANAAPSPGIRRGDAATTVPMNVASSAPAAQDMSTVGLRRASARSRTTRARMFLQALLPCAPSYPIYLASLSIPKDTGGTRGGHSIVRHRRGPARRPRGAERPPGVRPRDGGPHRAVCPRALRRRRCAFYVSTDRGFDRETVRSYLRLFSRLAGSAVAPDDALAHFGLAPAARTHVKNLTPEQRALMNFARMSLFEPEVIFCERPLVDVTPATRGLVTAWMGQVAEAGGILITAGEPLREALICPAPPSTRRMAGSGRPRPPWARRREGRRGRLRRRRGARLQGSGTRGRGDAAL